MQIVPAPHFSNFANQLSHECRSSFMQPVFLLYQSHRVGRPPERTPAVSGPREARSQSSYRCSWRQAGAASRSFLVSERVLSTSQSVQNCDPCVEANDLGTGCGIGFGYGDVALPNASPRSPDWPTIPGQGVANCEYTVWSGLFVQKGVPADIVRKLDADVRAALAEPDVAKKLAAFGAIPVNENLKTFVERIKRETSANEAIVRKADIQANK